MDQLPCRCKLRRHHYILGLLLAFISIATCQDTETVTQVFFMINEELPVKTPIGNVAAETNFGTNNGYKFKLVGETVSELVSLNISTGELVTAKTIDRETDCQNKRVCEFIFDITISGQDLYQVVTGNLTILDINDNTPTFETTEITLDLPESRPVNQEIPVSSANDLDKGLSNGIASFNFSSFSTKNDNFGLVIAENPDGSFAVSIKLIKELDYETLKNYELLIISKDAGVPVRTGTLTLNINVLDENDNKPVFEESVINIKVTEDYAVGKGIVVLKATDEDSGKNGEVSYQLAQQQSAEIYEFFSIDSVTGELKVKKKLDYEPGNSQKTIYVDATDSGDTPQSSQAVVHLTIEDAGNNPPKITLTFIAPEISPNVIGVFENATLQEAVVHVTVEDTDTGDNGNVTCNIYNTYFGLNEVSRRQNMIGFRIFVQRILDRELLDTHNVTINCIDGGGEEATDNFMVHVKDVNDNHPKFARAYYSAEMKENNTYGAKVIEVHATDDDIGENGKISYHIHPDDRKEFEAEENTGIIRARIALDREKYEDKVFKVLAIDNGTPARTSTTTVQVAVQDINDMVPMFIFGGDGPEYSFKIQERLVSGSKVDQVSAIDDDQGENKRLEYYMLPRYLPAGNHTVPFTVLEDGNIYSNMELDREERGSYRFQVGVHDFGQPQLNNTAWVNVRVLDFNDETPQFVFPSAARKNVSIEVLNEVSDVPITRIHAIDADEGINKELIYFIVEGNTDEIFHLDSNSGDLLIVKYVHIATVQTFSLEVSVWDKGKKPLSAKETLYVTLKYSNATQISPSSEDSKSYVIIVVAVVVITVVLSTTIIVVICLIRRKDLSKCGGNSVAGNKPGFLQGDRGLKGGSTQHLANDKVYPEALQPRNKKEVSFSLDEGDSLSSNDFKNLPLKDKMGPVSRQSKLGDMPEEKASPSSPVNGILQSPLRYTGVGGNTQQQQGKFMEQPEVQLTVGHQREDSHSETSGETATSHDSGRGSVEGDNHDFKFDLNPLNSSAYLIREDPTQSLPRTHPPPPKPAKDIPPKLPIKTADIKRPSVLFNGVTPNPNPTQNRTRNWCQNLDSTGSYPDSDYLSLGSNNNYSHQNSYQEPGFPMGQYNSNKNNNKLSPLGYRNLGYGGNLQFPTFRSNSTRDDDETTTTSGSYTINHEDLDEDVAQSQYQVSQMV